MINLHPNLNALTHVIILQITTPTAITLTIISITIAFLSFLWGVYSNLKMRNLQKKTFQYNREKDAKEEKKESLQIGLKKRQTDIDVQKYFDSIQSDFQFLDFQGLQAITVRKIKLENIYVKLRTVNPNVVRSYR